MVVHSNFERDERKLSIGFVMCGRLRSYAWIFWFWKKTRSSKCITTRLLFCDYSKRQSAKHLSEPGKCDASGKKLSIPRGCGTTKSTQQKNKPKRTVSTLCQNSEVLSRAKSIDTETKPKHETKAQLKIARPSCWHSAAHVFIRGDVAVRRIVAYCDDTSKKTKAPTSLRSDKHHTELC